MLATKMLLEVTMLVLVVAFTEGIVCPPNVCDFVKCEEPQGCKGGKTPGFCGCCEQCAKLEGELCGGGKQGLIVAICDTGLKCIENSLSGLCEPESKK